MAPAPARSMSVSKRGGRCGRLDELRAGVREPVDEIPEVGDVLGACGDPTAMRSRAAGEVEPESHGELADGHDLEDWRAVEPDVRNQKIELLIMNWDATDPQTATMLNQLNQH